MSTKLFLIETDNLFLDKMLRKLEDSGFQVYKCKEMEQVISEVEQSEAGIVILDIHSTQKQGLSIIEKLRKKLPQKQIIIINEPQDVKLSIKAMQMGAFDDLYIPFDFEELENIIQKAKNHMQ